MSCSVILFARAQAALNHGYPWSFISILRFWVSRVVNEILEASSIEAAKSRSPSSLCKILSLARATTSGSLQRSGS
jgi:hypothetical protein